MTKFIAIILCFIGVQALANNKVLVLGEEWTISGASRIWLDSDKVITAKASGGGVSIRGKKEGTAELRVGSQSYSVRVVTSLTQQTAALLESRVSKLVGLETDWDGSIPVVKGRLHSLHDYLALAKDLPAGCAWEFRAEIPERLQIAFESELQKRLGPQAPVHPLMYAGTPTALFNGPAEVAAHWSSLFARWGLILKRDETAVAMAPVIRVEIAIAEIRKDRAMNLGIKWPGSADASVLPNGSLSFQDLLFSAEAFESHGWGRLLARPNLLCRSGGEAEFVAGGEFPIKIFNYKIQDVVWKRYGIVLKVKPKADPSGRISLVLETEVSSIDPATTVDGVPGILTNKVASQFDLTRSRTIVLSGLLKNEDSLHRGGLPGLSGIPILGSLFGSQEWKSNRTELVVFVRPSIEKENL